MNRFFANVTKDLKKVKTLGGRENFSVNRPTINFEGSMPVADNSLRDSMAQQGARQQQEEAAKQAQYAQIAESLGSMVGGMVGGEKAAESKIIAEPQAKHVEATKGDQMGNPLAAAVTEKYAPEKMENGRSIETLGGLESVPWQRTEGNQPDQQEIRELPPGVELSDAQRYYENEVKPLLTRDYKKGGKDYDKRHDWKDILRSVGLGVLEAVGNADPRNGMAGILGAAIGGGGGGAIAGAFDRNFDNKVQDRAKLAQRLPQYQAMAQQEYDKNKDARAERNTQSIIDDRDLDRKESERKAKEAVRAGALKAINKLKRFDPKDPTQAALAKDAGLDPAELQGWDDSNPVTKTVAGRTYEYNKATRSFEPSNLPIEDSKTLVDYEVTTPEGEVRTYKVAQVDAARFATQMQALGMNINARKEAQQSSQTFTASQNQIKMDFVKGMKNDAAIIGTEKAKGKARQAFKLMFQKENKRMPTKQEVDAFMSDEVDPIFAATGEAVPQQ